MRIKKRWAGPTSAVTYMIDVGGGMFSQSAVPSAVALEMAENAEGLEVVGIDGIDYLKVGPRHFLPAEVFDLQGRKVPRHGEPAESGQG